MVRATNLSVISIIRSISRAEVYNQLLVRAKLAPHCMLGPDRASGSYAEYLVGVMILVPI